MFYVKHNSTEMKVDLPYPVSVNNVWLRSHKGMYLNPKVDKYRKEVWANVYHKQKFNNAKLRLEVKMYPPNDRCDIDNILKTLLDALQHAGTFSNDCQVHQLYVEKLEKKEGGLLEIKLSSLD